MENPSANPRRSREAFGCGMRSRAASCVPLSPSATDRSWICLASLAFDSSSSGDSSPRSRKTFPEPSDSGSYDGCASLIGFVILLFTLSAVFRGC